MRKNPLLVEALQLLKEWQSQLGQGDRPDLDKLVATLEKKQRALVLDVPHGEVTALLVAIHNHAHGFLASVQKAKNASGQGPDASTLKAWEQHGAFLNSLKADIKRQAGIK